MTISSAKGQGKRVLSCIRILSDKARHEVIIITEQGGSLVVMVGASQDGSRMHCQTAKELHT
jgi:hypothetical protein